ncbi:MAG: type II toxin-antitoxin system VapC family toxin [Thermoplasmata archaeon]
MIYIDSNVLIYAALDPRKKGKWCRSVLRQIESGKQPALTSSLTFDELVYIVRRESGLDESLRIGQAALEMSNLYFVPVDDIILLKSIELMRALRLFPRDAIHAASATNSGVFVIYSEDKDFDKVKELERVWLT